MAMDMRRPLLAAIQAALDEVQAESQKKRPRIGAGRAVLIGAGLYTVGRVAARGRGRDLLAAVEERLPHPDQESGDEDEQFDDEPGDDDVEEPDAEADEDDEPEAEADEDQEPEAEADEDEEPEAEADEDESEGEADAEDQPEAEADEDEAPARRSSRGRGKARSRR